MLFSSLSSKLVVEEFTIQVTRKPIKSLRLSIQPNTGKIRMSAPLRTFDTTIRSFVISRLDWIRKHISRIDHHNLQVLEYRTGEVHLFEGRGYELDFEISTARSTARSASACIQDEKIVLACPSDATTLHKHKLLTRWYKNELERRVPELIYRWESVLGVQVYSWSTRQMKTRWWTCNTRSKKILLNLELMKKSPDCLQYVVVHEMVHLLEASHNARFHRFMTHYLPDWKTTKRKLNGFLAEKDC